MVIIHGYVSLPEGKKATLAKDNREKFSDKHGHLDRLSKLRKVWGGSPMGRLTTISQDDRWTNEEWGD